MPRDELATANELSRIPVKGFPLSDTETRVSPCAVEATGVVRVPFGEIAGLRKSLVGSAARPVPPSLVKHADHQSVVAIAAVLRAVESHGWHDRSFAEWTVIAAPRFLGRVSVTGAAERFKRIGVPGMSPLIIPTLSLHAVSASVSLVLESRGFNFGVGGGPGHLVEGLLASLGTSDSPSPGGVWLVITGFDPEPIPDVLGRESTIPTAAYGVALGLTPAEASTARHTLRIVPTSAVSEAPSPDLVALADFLAAPLNSATTRKWFCPIPGGGAIELVDHRAHVAGDIDRDAAKVG